MKEAIIILGAGVMQGPAINIAKELGYHAVALDGSKEAPCVSMADQFEQIDLKAKEDIEIFARTLQNKFDRIGIMTAGTDFSSSVAWVAEKLGLPGIPYETALNASDKSRMRDCFKKAGLPSPEFVTISSGDWGLGTRDWGSESGEWGVGSGEWRLLLEKLSCSNHTKTANNNPLSPVPCPPSPLLPQSPVPSPQSPLVIKPVDNMGSRGCRRVDNLNDLHEAAKIALGFSRCGRAIIETYMDGPEFSVDAIVYHGEIIICGLADRHIFFPPYFIEMGHTMPTIIEGAKQSAMLDVFRAGIRALGLDEKQNVGAAKGDIKLTENGPMIGEIAARLSGGYMSGWTYPYSSGVRPIKAAIQQAMGQKPQDLVPLKNWTCAERAFISIPGRVKQLAGTRDWGLGTGDREENFVCDVFLRVKEGDRVSFPENNVTKCGNVIASAPDRETAIQAAETAAKAILIKLDSTDQETAKFLTPNSSLLIPNSPFPPNAFDLTEDMKAALAQLPNTNPQSPVPSPQSLHSATLHPFPIFTESNITDYMNRTINENLQAVRLLTGLPLQIASENAENIVENTLVLARPFWQAFIRGAYQGAVYYIESLCGEIDDKENQNPEP